VTAELVSAPIGPGLQEIVTLYGNPHVRSEQLRDYEVGYRRELNERLSLDVDSFLSFYRNLSTLEIQPTIIVPGLVTQFQVPVIYGSLGRAIDYGGEASVTWKANSLWRISPGYSMVHINFGLEPGSKDQLSAALAGNTPQHSFQVRSRLNLTPRIQFDQTVFWNEGFPNHTIPAHMRLDARLAWKVGESVEVSLAGQNLTSPNFLEFGNFEETAGSQAPRSLIGKITWRF
jgi:outer membrane receptor protein involved in Fe transport